MIWHKALGKGKLPLIQGCVDIWCFDRTSLKCHYNSLSEWLSEDEKITAAQYIFDTDREHYIARRALLRFILSRYVQIDPCLLQICNTEHGKPRLINAPYLQFNLSKNDDLILYAITRDSAVGIDVESLSQRIDIDAISPLICYTEELEILKNTSVGDRQRIFLKIWTRKEAALKARGLGLSYIADANMESHLFFRTFEFKNSVATLCAFCPINHINFHWENPGG